MALTSKLSAIGDAIRAKNGTTDLMTLDAMPAAIEAIETGSGGVDVTVPRITNNCPRMFYNDKWNWVIEQLGDSITTGLLGPDVCEMFAESKTLESIPFDFVFHPNNQTNCSKMFYNCQELKEIGAIVKLQPLEFSSMFEGCWNLRYLPEFENITFNDVLFENDYNWQCRMFYDCRSLRSIPENRLKLIHSKYATSWGHFFEGTFSGCYVLDEIIGLSPETGVLTENTFRGTFNSCHRVKDIIFKTQSDGSPFVAEWTNQTINLYGATSEDNQLDTTSNPEYSVGYFRELSDWIQHSSGGYMQYNKVTDYNSGITEDKEVTDDATYAALKNDPDWYTRRAAYSRYNHDSAVNTINSLPDTSAYVTANGGTNTIIFYGAAGASTDGGAINTLTEEEIAVAAVKGWTVTLV